MKKIVLKADGAFLILAGLFGTVTDLLSFFQGSGPWGNLYHNNPHIIGLFEDHCFAILTGCLLWHFAKAKEAILWNGVGVAAHLICGLSNVYWFDVFHSVNASTQGLVVTVIHFLFITLNLASIFRTKSKSIASRQMSYSKNE